LPTALSNMADNRLNISGATICPVSGAKIQILKYLSESTYLLPGSGIDFITANCLVNRI